MRRMRIVSLLLGVAMIGTTVVPTYGEEIGTIMDLTEEPTETSTEDTEAATEETEAVKEFEEYMATEDTITDANASLEDFTPEEEISEQEASMNREKVKAFVERMYTKALGREADAAGVEYWTDTLMKKEKTAAEVGYGFVFSEEYKNKNAKDDAFVEMLYNVFMNRKSDKEGKNYGWDYCKKDIQGDTYIGSLRTLRSFQISVRIIKSPGVLSPWIVKEIAGRS